MRKSYKDYPPPPGFQSDGCTVPAIFRPLYRRYRDACVWHDWARRHLVHYDMFTVPDADKEFKRYMRDLGAWQPLLQITWLVVKWTRDRYSATLPLPRESWYRYVFKSNKEGDPQ